MQNPLQPFLDLNYPLILDGALATELENRGANLDDPLWSARLLLESPGLIKQVHHDYFVAGADVAITASYQATFEGLAQRGLDHQQAQRIFKLSIQLAQEARTEFWAEEAHRVGRLYPLVAASVGCYGAYLANGAEYHGNYGLTVGALVDWHRPRLAVLAAGGADLLACETIPSQAEGEALVQLLTEFPDVPAWLSFSCRDDEHVNHGEPLADCIALVNDCPNVVAVGINCTHPRFITGLLRQAYPATDKPILVYPNRGEGWDAEAKRWLPDPDTLPLAGYAHAWANLGAQLIGGCCRTTPQDIAALSLKLRRDEVSQNEPRVL